MSNLASTGRLQMRYIKESTYGTTPGAGNCRNLRITGESLNFDLSKEESKELRSDRQVGGATTVDAQAAGGLNFHLQYAEYDQFFEGLFQSAYTVFGTNGVGATFTGTMATGTITASVATSGASLFTLLQQGQWFRLNAPGGLNDGKWFRVHPTTPPTSTVIALDASTPASAEAGIASCTVSTSRLTNGVTEASFSMEKNFADVTQFLLYKGMNVSKANINFAAAALTDGSFEFMGKDMARAAVTGLPGTPVASLNYEIMNGARGVGQLWEGTAPITGTFIKSMSMSIDNNARGQKALGNLGNVGIGFGDCDVTGQIEVYFANGTMFDKFLADTYTQIIVASQDVAKQGYVITLPRVLLMNAKVTAQGKNQDVMATFDYQAFSDDANANAAYRKTIFWDRLGAAVTP